MSFTKIFTCLALIAISFISCKKDKDVVPFDSNQDDLIITIQEQYVNPPSRVSVFFKVERKNGDPVAGLTEDNFTIYEKGRNDDVERLLSVDEATRQIGDNAVVFQNRSILLLDLSGSVLNNSLPQLKEAANEFIDDVIVDEVNSSTTVGIWWFDGKDAIHRLIDFTSDGEALHDAIDNITPSISTDTSTDLFGAILKSTALAESKIEEAQLQNIMGAVSIIVFTDGTDQAARYSREEAYAAVDNASEEIKYYSIGLGNEIDETVLNKIGKTSAVFADNTAALTEKFEEIAQLVIDAANAFYLFEYCTPKRDGSGTNELHIVAKRNDEEGRKITTFDATGFSDDCDLD